MERITEIQEFIKSMYPSGLRAEASTEGTTIEKYDKVRATLFEFLESILDNLKGIHSVSTIDESMLIFWEQFLGLPENPDNSTEALRRSTILTKLNLKKGSVYAVKTVVSDTLGIPYEDVVINEYYKEYPAQPDELWSYEIVIPEVVEGGFAPDVLLALLNDTHMAHNKVFLSFVTADMVWADEDNPVAVDSTWGDGYTGETYSHWN